ncbi:sugar phosphate nucleotidyltransferase [Acidimicrobiaceae bacterium]|nr:sugar phosphate nucleotidyltransferase [Acidimicrobiaceae bacterium]
MSKIYTVIAAGGLGKRLQNYGNSKKTKMLLEINGQSMITKQLNQLISWNLDNFIVITNPKYDKLIKDDLSKNMSDLDVEYSLQDEQLGVAHALLQAEKLVPEDAKILYILGDNFFEFNPLKDLDISESNASIFLTKVSNPEEFGVVEIVDNKIKSIQEKPTKPKSDYIAVGLYLFDNLCFEYIKSIQKSDRGEYEITSLIEKYLNNHSLNYQFTTGWWVDAGTPEAIKTIEKLL